MLGFFGDHSSIRKKFYTIPHNVLTIRFRLWIFDTWDPGEKFQVYIDD